MDKDGYIRVQRQISEQPMAAVALIRSKLRSLPRDYWLGAEVVHMLYRQTWHSLQNCTQLFMTATALLRMIRNELTMLSTAL